MLGPLVTLSPVMSSSHFHRGVAGSRTHDADAPSRLSSGACLFPCSSCMTGSGNGGINAATRQLCGGRQRGTCFLPAANCAARAALLLLKHREHPGRCPSARRLFTELTPRKPLCRSLLSLTKSRRCLCRPRPVGSTQCFGWMRGVSQKACPIIYPAVPVCSPTNGYGGCFISLDRFIPL